MKYSMCLLVKMMRRNTKWQQQKHSLPTPNSQPKLSFLDPCPSIKKSKDINVTRKMPPRNSLGKTQGIIAQLLHDHFEILWHLPDPGIVSNSTRKLISCQMSMSPIQQHYQARWIQLQLIFIILWQLEWNHYGKTNVFGMITTPHQTWDVNITRHLRHHVLSVNAFHLSNVWKSKQQAVHCSLQPENFCQIQGPNFIPFCLSGFQGTTIPGFTPRSAACARGSPTKTPLANCFTSTSIPETWLHETIDEFEV